MIWFMPRPWADSRERSLFVAAFCPDDAKALGAAQAWFGAVASDDIAYRHHRLIAAIGHRFPGRAELDPYRPIITSVAKQLWLRGARVMTVLGHVAQTFETMRVPWMVMGNAAWHCVGNPMFRDVERAEIVVAEEAFTYAMSRLWDVGWKPYDGTLIYAAPDPVQLVNHHRSALQLQSDVGMLDADPALTAASLWSQVRTVPAFGGTLPFPSDELILRYRDAGPQLEDDFQWAVDLTEMRVRSGGAWQGVPAKYRSLARRARLLVDLANG